MTKIYRTEDVPNAHKIATYDALCAHFASHLDHYYTEPGYVNPKYDHGAAQETPTETTLIQVEDGELLVTMGVQGWADYLVFSVELPILTRDDLIGEGSTPTIEVATAVPSTRGAWIAREIATQSMTEAEVAAAIDTAIRSAIENAIAGVRSVQS